MNIAVIPARGGSKRIPRKNIKLFGGKPMIAWSIDAALQSACFDRIIVSTDDEEIAEVATAYGAEVPFMRPPELSDDYTATTPVIAHSIQWQLLHGEAPSAVCCIYATAPFMLTADLSQGFKTLSQLGCAYVFAVTSYAFPIQRAIKLNKEGKVEMFQPEHFNTRSQDLEAAYHDAGQFCWGRPEAWLTGKPVFSVDSASIILPRYRVQDIDTLEDWERAEWQFKIMQAELIDG
jgi:pseudaminic acid cytidylyltransferase